MNLKYYLRGLGIGIVVTAVIMGAASGGKKDKMSDAEIKARAAELGMVEAQTEGVLADLEQMPQEETDSSEETPAEDAAAAEGSAVPPENEADAAADEEVKGPEETPSPEPEETPSSEPEEPDLSESIIIEIKEGESSYAICRKLEGAGLIGSASAFDAYLYENGFDRKLRTGSYEIPAGAEPETIAEILTFGR